MPLSRVMISNFKSIERCDISLSELNLFIGENGTGKSNVLEAINYFYNNLTEKNTSDSIFDENNHFSNEVRISIAYNLTDFVKISKSKSRYEIDLFGDRLVEKVKYENYHKMILSMASEAKDNTITFELSQVKGRSIQWNKKNYDERFIIKSLFPVFLIDTRNLDVTRWEYLWDVLSELGKVSYEERKALEIEINEMMINNDKELSRKIKRIIEIFDEADVSVKTVAAKDYAKNLIKLFFSGDVIHKNGRQLGYFSTGTNSVQYIELLLKSIDEISKTKLKEPLVMLDEPELSLHPGYIDELAKSILDVNAKLRIIIASHSPRLTKNIILTSDKATIYDVKLNKTYSQFQKLKKFPNYSPKSTYRVTDDHINSYFSRAILFVEGATERELLFNPSLQLLFPSLKSIDVYEGMSQGPDLKIMDPMLTKAKTPYTRLVDIDKVISYDIASNKFRIVKEFIHYKKKECFQYRNKHQAHPHLYHQYKRIIAMCDNLKVHFYLPFFSCNDINYRALITAIRQYIIQYNVFAFSTTVEGALINKRTVDFALSFLQKRKSKNEFKEFHSLFNNLKSTDQINTLRMVFNGKSDLLQKRGTILNEFPKEKLILERASVGEKTSGWISNYIDDFFKEHANIKGDYTIALLKKHIEDENNKNKLYAAFEYAFPELHSLLERYTMYN